MIALERKEKKFVLTLFYRLKMVVPPRLELELTVSKTAVLPLHHGTVVGGFLVSAPCFGEIFFKKIPYQRAKSNPACAGL